MFWCAATVTIFENHRPSDPYLYKMISAFTVMVLVCVTINKKEYTRTHARRRPHRAIGPLSVREEGSPIEDVVLKGLTANKNKSMLLLMACAEQLA